MSDIGPGRAPIPKAVSQELGGVPSCAEQAQRPSSLPAPRLPAGFNSNHSPSHSQTLLWVYLYVCLSALARAGAEQGLQWWASEARRAFSAKDLSDRR